MTKLMGNGKDTQEDEEEEEVEEQYDEQFDSDHEEEEDHHPESTLQPTSHLRRLAKPQPTAA